MCYQVVQFDDVPPLPSLNTPPAPPPPPSAMPRELDEFQRQAAQWAAGQMPPGHRLPAINARWQASKPQTGGDTYTPRWLQIRAALMGIKGWWVNDNA